MNRLNRKLNEAFEDKMLDRDSNMDEEKEIGITGAVPSVYRDAINTHRTIRQVLKDRFKEQNKNIDEFIKKNHDRDTKKVSNPELKKMKLSESLFEDYNQDIDQIKMVCEDYLEEELVNKIEDNLVNKFYNEDHDYDPDWASEFEEDTTKSARDLYIKKLIKSLFANAGKNESLKENLEANEEDGWGEEVEDILTNFFESAEGLAYEVRNCVRGSYAVSGDTIDDLIGYLTSLSEELQGAIDQLSDDSETLQEGQEKCEICGKEPCECEDEEDVEIKATLEEAVGDIYYKKTREPLADIIMLDLTSGEVVYKENESGKLIPTHNESVNLDAEDIGANDDDKGEYIIGWSANEDDIKKMEAIAKKYGKEFKSGKDEKVSGDKKFFTKIYINEEDWDEPYFDPDVKVKGKK